MLLTGRDFNVDSQQIGFHVIIKTQLSQVTCVRHWFAWRVCDGCQGWWWWWWTG